MLPTTNLNDTTGLIVSLSIDGCEGRVVLRGRNFPINHEEFVMQTACDRFFISNFSWFRCSGKLMSFTNRERSRSSLCSAAAFFTERQKIHRHRFIWARFCMVMNDSLGRHNNFSSLQNLQNPSGCGADSFCVKLCHSLFLHKQVPAPLLFGSKRNTVTNKFTDARTHEVQARHLKFWQGGNGSLNFEPCRLFFATSTNDSPSLKDSSIFYFFGLWSDRGLWARGTTFPFDASINVTANCSATYFPILTADCRNTATRTEKVAYLDEKENEVTETKIVAGLSLIETRCIFGAYPSCGKDDPNSFYSKAGVAPYFRNELRGTPVPTSEIAPKSTATKLIREQYTSSATAKQTRFPWSLEQFLRVCVGRRIFRI